MTDYLYFSKNILLNDSEPFILKKISLSLNFEDDITQLDSNNNLNNIEFNQSTTTNQPINYLNQIENLSIYKSEKTSNFSIFDDYNPNINFHYNNNLSIKYDIPTYIYQDSSSFNLKKNASKLPDNIFLNKKRNIFKIVYPNEFFIFNRFGENQNQRFLIDQILQKLVNSNTNIMYKKKGSTLRKRKENADNIRKKIKTRFFHTLKEIINRKLKFAGSKKKFDRLPQNFLCNISKNINRIMFDKTFKELFSINFSNNKNEHDANIKKNKKNLKTLEYLEKKKDISEKSNYNCYKNLKLNQIYDEYLRSKEFENEIIRLKLEGEPDNYIYNYIKLACDLNNFFYK